MDRFLRFFGRPADGELSRSCSAIDAIREKFTGETAFRPPFWAAGVKRFEASKNGQKKA
jgi:hypothetical protein